MYDRLKFLWISFFSGIELFGKVSVSYIPVNKILIKCLFVVNLV